MFSFQLAACAFLTVLMHCAWSLRRRDRTRADCDRTGAEDGRRHHSLKLPQNYLDCPRRAFD